MGLHIQGLHHFFLTNPSVSPVHPGKSGKVIYMGTLSKVIAPGIRMSYMVLPETIVKQYQSQAGFYFFQKWYMPAYKLDSPLLLIVVLLKSGLTGAAYNHFRHLLQSGKPDTVPIIFRIANGEN